MRFLPWRRPFRRSSGRCRIRWRHDTAVNVKKSINRRDSPIGLTQCPYSYPQVTGKGVLGVATDGSRSNVPQGLANAGGRGWFGGNEDALLKATGMTLVAFSVSPYVDLGGDVEALAFRLGRKEHEDEQGQSTEERDEPDEDHPAAEIRIVQTADNEGQGRNDDSQAPDD